jgi:hypothetical protein
VAGIATSAGGFYGFLVAELIKYCLNISEINALLYVGLPTAIIFAAYLWPKLPKLLGVDD